MNAIKVKAEPIEKEKTTYHEDGYNTSKTCQGNPLNLQTLF